MQHVLAPYGYGGVVGFCGSVAEGGFVLGGGIGMQSRLYGLGLDNVVSMRIVLADGNVRQVSHDSTDAFDQDLFWALRGAGGGSWGVVTEMDYRIHQTSRQIIVSFLTLPSPTDMATFLYRLGAKEGELPRNLLVMHDYVDTATFFWSGRTDQEIQGSMAFLESLVEELIPEVNANTRTFRQSTYDWATAFGNADAIWAQDVYAARCWYGFLLPENNTLAVWQDVIRHISTGVHSNSSMGFLSPDIELWGGAIHDTPWNATAFPYRSAIYNVGVLLTVPANEPNAAAIFDKIVQEVNAWWPQVAQYLTGSYVNYPTLSLGDEYPRAQWGNNLPRLVDIKRRVDPDNMFEFPMSVPLEVS